LTSERDTVEATRRRGRHEQKRVVWIYLLKSHLNRLGSEAVLRKARRMFWRLRKKVRKNFLLVKEKIREKFQRKTSAASKTLRQAWERLKSGLGTLHDMTIKEKGGMRDLKNYWQGQRIAENTR
jgi:hypothetical protein